MKTQESCRWKVGSFSSKNEKTCGKKLPDLQQIQKHNTKNQFVTVEKTYFLFHD